MARYQLGRKLSDEQVRGNRRLWARSPASSSARGRNLAMSSARWFAVAARSVRARRRGLGLFLPALALGGFRRPRARRRSDRPRAPPRPPALRAGARRAFRPAQSVQSPHRVGARARGGARRPALGVRAVVGTAPRRNAGRFVFLIKSHHAGSGFGLDYVDLNFLGRPEIIATPSCTARPASRSSIPGRRRRSTLTAALETQGHPLRGRAADPDHAHPSRSRRRDGTMVEKHPHIDVIVHGRGAPHLADPSKLLASAGRLYAQDMDRLWGEVKPVPRRASRVVEGGETLSVVGREVEGRVHAGPRVASRVAIFDTASRVAFVGDTAGIRRGSGAYVHAADAAARHRPRGVARQRAEDSRVGSRHVVPDALRSAPRRAAALPGDVREHRRSGAASSGGCSRTRPRPTRSGRKRFIDEAYSTASAGSARPRRPITRRPAGSTIPGRASRGTGANVDVSIAARFSHMVRRDSYGLALPSRCSYCSRVTAAPGDLATCGAAAGYSREHDLVPRGQAHRMERRVLLPGGGRAVFNRYQMVSSGSFAVFRSTPTPRWSPTASCSCR